MDLLVFAHRAEAQAFLKNEKWKSVATKPFSLYQSENEASYLLISGEGIENAMTATTWASTVIGDNLQRIINLGVCASLNEDYPIESTYLVRTSYKQNTEKEMSFRSFTTNHYSSDALDINTVERRVLSKEEADHLDNFAPLVDREFWGVAFAANKLEVDLIGIKTVSDIAGKNENICEIVKEDAQLWSELLYDKLQQTDNVKESVINDDILIDERFNSFHFTFSQKQQLKNLSKVIEARGEELIEFLEHNKLFEFNEDHRPKDRATHLIRRINECLFPYDEKINSKIETIKKELSKYDKK